MHRILIIGSNGAGKSTFSRSLQNITGLPVIHLDRLYWQGCWEVVPDDEFRVALLRQAEKPCWIIDGNNIRSLRARLALADTVFWFEFPPLLCLWGILRREWHYRGQARPDMPEGCVSRLNFSFLKSAWTFNRKNHDRIAQILPDFPSLQVIRFTRRSQVRQYLKTLKQKANPENPETFE